MQIITNNAGKELKKHGDSAFPFLVSYERLSGYETGSFLWHWHPEIELTYIHKGEMLYKVNQNTFHLKEGQVLFGRGAYELYRTKDATYVTATYRCPEDWWFFNFNSGWAIIDNKRGDRYMLREVEYYPTDTCFWIKDSRDKFVRFVLVFPPLPKKVKTVDFFIPSGESRFNFDGSEKHMSGLRVEDLRPKHRIPQGEVIR